MPTIRRTMVLALAVLSASLAFAATSPLQFSGGIGGGVLSLMTSRLDKGWFSTRNTLDRSKTALVTTYTLGATSCSSARAPAEVNSTTVGAFTPQLNSQGSVTGYFWDTAVDLSAAANHWNLHYHCDGQVEVHGCDQAIPVTVQMTALDRQGNCHTYVNDLGASVCASDTHTFALAPVQDPDVTDVCSVDCGIGPCVSACEHACDPIADKEARQACKKACPCNCKLQLPPPPLCPAHEECD